MKNIIPLFLLFSFLSATTLIVPTDFPNIQAGIDASMNGDTVLVLDGVYSGEGNYNIQVSAFDRSITLLSESGPENCIIDCQWLGSGFIVNNDEHTVFISGFTVINGGATGGGGIFIGPSSYAHSVTIDRCIIRNNWAEYGGGIEIILSHPIISNCLIINNSAENGGNGVLVDIWATVDFYNCIFFDDIVVAGEYAAYTHYCLFSPDIPEPPPSWDENSIIADPLFVDPDNQNYHFNIESPCINAGDPEYPTDPDSTQIDIGPFYYHLELQGDINFDSDINILDLVNCVNIILSTIDPYNALIWAADINNDSIVDIADIIIIVDIIIS